MTQHMTKALAAAQVDPPRIITEVVRARDSNGEKRMWHLLGAQRLALDLAGEIQKAIAAEIAAHPELVRLVAEREGLMTTNLPRPVEFSEAIVREPCRESAYERQQERLMEDGPGPSLLQQQQAAWRLK